MDNKEFAKKLRALHTIAHYGPNGIVAMWLENGAGFRKFELDNQIVSFYPVSDVVVLNETVEAIFSGDRMLTARFSFAAFENEIIGWLLQVHQENRDFDKLDYDKFKAVLQNRQDITYDIVTRVEGLLVRGPITQLGDFTVYSTQGVKDLLDPSKMSLLHQQEFDILEGSVFLGLTVTAKDEKRCYEMASECRMHVLQGRNNR